MAVDFWCCQIQSKFDDSPHVYLRIEHQLFDIVQFSCITLLDGTESAVNISSVGTRVCILYPRVRSSESVDVYPFNHFNVAKVRSSLRRDVAQFLHEVHHKGLYVGGR